MRFVENNRQTLLGELRELLADADDALFAVAYVRSSGIRLSRRSLEHLRERQGRLRVLLTLRPPISDAAAIRTLIDLGAHVRCYDASHVFHIKTYIVRNRDRTFAIVGSANLSGSALTLAREWCLRGDNEQLPIDEMRAEFERLWSSSYAADVTENTSDGSKRRPCPLSWRQSSYARTRLQLLVVGGL